MSCEPVVLKLSVMISAVCPCQTHDNYTLNYSLYNPLHTGVRHQQHPFPQTAILHEGSKVLSFKSLVMEKQRMWSTG